MSLQVLSVNGQPALVRQVGDDADMIFTVRVNQLSHICWLYTLHEASCAIVPGGCGLSRQPFYRKKPLSTTMAIF